MLMKIFRPTLAVIIFVSNLYFFQSSFSQSVTVTAFKSGFTYPIDIKNCGDDRLFVSERRGVIRIIDAAGNLLPTPFLDVSAKVSSLNSEEGFLNMNFSPDYATSGKFYVSYTDSIKWNEPGGPELHSVIEEYKVSSGDPNVADPSSALTILTQHQPFQNHNGGNIMFGADGFLYINFGDGGSGGDPMGNGQNRHTFLGKILRIDVSGSSMAQPYVVPPSNPFFNDADPLVKKEIWAYGLRNPWRASFDRLTHDLWIGDVGQDNVEEIDFQQAGAPGGDNYGWNIMEGNSCYPNGSSCSSIGIHLPIHDYSHAVGIAVTGGYVYRSIQSNVLWGVYLYSDFGGGWIDGFTQTGGVASSVHRYLASTGAVIAFGEDRYGELYLCKNADGTIYKLEDADPNKKPKAYFTPLDQGSNVFLLQGQQGRNITYQWFLDNNPIGGATNPDFTASVPGVYTLQVTNGAGQTDLSTQFTLSALPVNLSEFTASRTTSGDINLKWKTVAEQNNKGFEIQRSLNNGANYTAITFLDSKAPGGNSNSGYEYSYLDKSPGSSEIYYRIKQVDRDGKFSFTPVRIVGPNTGSNHVLIFPNPAQSEITIVLPDNYSKSTLIIRDASGRALINRSLSGNSNTISISGYAKGIYIVEIRDELNNILKQEKIIRQ
ncbi:MAG: hypothetical protein C5B52_04385 [Bacteroidetes bacterium]|nr:MAG: hypothetical protein C5B52_04385 [Bacteroidota bacterium]